MIEQPVQYIYPLTRLGVKVFPLKPRTKDGHLLKSWKEASCYSDVIDQWAARWPGCNWGVACGELAHQDTTSTAKLPQLLVVDCDGQTAYDWFCSQHPALAGGCVVRTGRDGGGAHVYLWAPHDCELTIAAHIKLPSGAPEGISIDVRCNNGYVVAPGSVHPSGRRYEWAPGCFDEDGELTIKDAPTEWFDGRLAKYLLVGEPAEQPTHAPSTPRAPSTSAASDDYDHDAWTNYYNRAADEWTVKIAKCDDGEGHEMIWNGACRLYELTQPWQDDPAHIIESAVRQWTFRKGGRSLHMVLSDVYRSCSDASKLVTRVNPRDVLRTYHPEAEISFNPAQVDALVRAETAPKTSEPSTPSTPSAPSAPSAPTVTWKKCKDGTERCDHTLSNLRAILAGDPQMGMLAYDESSDRAVWRRAPADHADWTGRALRDSDLVDIACAIEQTYGTTWPLATIQDVLGNVAQAHRFNAFLDDIRSTPWDGVDRLTHGAARYFGAEDTPYHNEALRRWLIGLCARQYATVKAPVKMDYVLLLQGPQGCGKTSGLEALARPEFFATTALEPSNKDCIMALHSAAVVVYDELGGRQRRDIEVVKNHITTTVDKYRKPWGRVVEEQPRRCAMAATTNEETPLCDATGGRRFLLVRCGNIDVKAITADRSQMLAQAMAEYDAWMRGDDGARPWWFRSGEDDALIADATAKQYAATYTDEIETAVIDYISTAFVQHDTLTIKDIIEGVFRPENAKETLELVTRHSRSVSNILKLRCGLECVHTRKGNQWQRKPMK